MSLQLLRPCLRPFLTPQTHSTPASLQQPTRFFLTSSVPHSVTASRTLPFPALAIYDIIADIQSYPAFIPYCQSAKITSWSNEDPHYQRTWPQTASLTVGYGDSITESFTSRLFCAPPIPEKGRAGVGYVEAISGSAEHQVTQEHISHHTHESNNSSETDPLEFLRTRWMVRGFPFKPAPEDGSTPQDGKVEPESKACEMSDVSLSIQYKFRNPMYDMMSRAVTPKLAEKIIEAFEERVKGVLTGQTSPKGLHGSGGKA